MCLLCCSCAAGFHLLRKKKYHHGDISILVLNCLFSAYKCWSFSLQWGIQQKGEGQPLLHVASVLAFGRLTACFSRSVKPWQYLPRLHSRTFTKNTVSLSRKRLTTTKKGRISCPHFPTVNIFFVPAYCAYSKAFQLQNGINKFHRMYT